MKSHDLGNAIQLILLLLLTSLLSIMFCASTAKAVIKVDISETGSIPLEEPLTLSASCTVLDPFPPFPSACPEDATWRWEIWGTWYVQPDDYELLFPDTPHPIFIGHTKGTFIVGATVCIDGECGFSPSHAFQVWDANTECRISSKYPFVVYESPAFPSDYECLLDEDANGLSDIVEQTIANCFVPTFAFDAGEECWSLGPEEPYVVYNMAVDAFDEENDAFHLTIRYGMVWQFDGGFQSSWICGDAHLGDTQALTVGAWLKKRKGKAEWFAELDYIYGFTSDPRIFYVTYTPPPDCIWPPLPFDPRPICHWWMIHDGTHPVVYPTQGKHHFRPAPGEYKYGTLDMCTENAYGNNYPWRTPIPERIPHFPSVSPVAFGPQGGPPIVMDQDRVAWANACWLLKDNSKIQKAVHLRNVDLADWAARPCSLRQPYALMEACCYSPLTNYLPGNLGGPMITDESFLAGDKEVAAGIYSLVQGGFDPDIDKDGRPFWTDPCPFSDVFVDSDGDGLCDPIDICPHDFHNDADNDGICGIPLKCDAGGPYDVECSGRQTMVVLNGLSSSHPSGLPLTYSWSTDCQAEVSDGHNGIALLGVLSEDCQVDCNVFLTVSDGAGASAACSSQVAINDTIAPDIICPSSLTLECSDSSLPSYAGWPVASDVCMTSPSVFYFDTITPGSCAHEWTINRTWTASDHCDQSKDCTQSISVKDKTRPTITCPADITIGCEESVEPSQTGNATAHDNCDESPAIGYFDSVSNPGCLGDNTIFRTWQAQDLCGNISTCTQVITVKDAIAPVIACNTPKTIIPPAAPMSFAASAEDNCDPEPVVEITGVDCFFYTKHGKRISKLGSCQVHIDNSEITILDSGGVGTNITWSVRAVDCANNESTAKCTVIVTRPGK